MTSTVAPNIILITLSIGKMMINTKRVLNEEIDGSKKSLLI